MPGRDVDRLHPLPRAQHGADARAGPRAASRPQPGEIALRGARLIVAAGEPRLRDADGGRIQPEPEMAGEPEAARMGVAVAVAEDQVRPSRRAARVPRAAPELRERRADPARRETPSVRSTRTCSVTSSPGKFSITAAARMTRPPSAKAASRPATDLIARRPPGPKLSEQITAPASDFCTAIASLGDRPHSWSGDGGPSPHFSPGSWSARRRQADRAGKPRSAMWCIGQAV